MNSKIRAMQEKDKKEVIDMMRIFYTSPAVYTNGSEEVYQKDFEACVSDNPFLSGYVIEDADAICGYAMVAKSFSTEFGKPCIWIEDIYIKEEFRGTGMGKALMEFVTNAYTDCIFRLEVEEENMRAIRLYESCGFTELPYMELKK